MSATPEFHPTHCVRYRYRYSACHRCTDSCPQDAIRLTDEGVTLDPTRCDNCALCTVACHTEALTATNLARIDLLKQAAAQPRFFFACAPSGTAGDAVVPCLGALEPGMLAYLAKRGVSVNLSGSEHCAECARGAQGAAQLALNLAGLEVLRKAAGGGGWAQVELSASVAGQGQTKISPHQAARRQFFRRFASAGQSDPGQQEDREYREPLPMKAIRAARPFSTSQRELIQLLWPQPEPHDVLESHAALPLAVLGLKPGCTCCEACARVCPTGALEVKESTTAWSLAFRASRCVACGVCIEACQPKVLLFDSQIPAAALREDQPAALHALPKKRCNRCDRFFVTNGGTDLCPVCNSDEEDFAALFG